MIPVISVELMRESDKYTIKNFISSKELMYKAGKAVFDIACPADGSVIVCGSGNNAGDGYVIALEMEKAGLNPTLLLLGNKFSEDGLYYFNRCKEKGINYTYADENTTFEGYSDIIDCIFGTGFKGEPKGLVAQIIDKINQSQKRVISVDINSGLNGNNGKYIKCIKSDLTVSIGYFKTGFFLGEAHRVIGKVINADIGIHLIGTPYSLIDKVENFPYHYTDRFTSFEDNPVEELKSLAKGDYIRCSNILTNGTKTYIIAGDTSYGN